MHHLISLHFLATNLLQILINYLYPYVELFNFFDQGTFIIITFLLILNHSTY